MDKHEVFLSKLKTKRPELFTEFEFIDTYMTATTRLKAVHRPCGRELMVLPNSMLSRGNGCLTCSRERANKEKRKSHSDFIAELPDNITIKGEYQGANKRITVHCKGCNETYSVSPREVVKRGCTRCSKSYHRSLNDVVKEVMEATKGDYCVTSTSYKNAHTNINIRHEVCGTEYQVSMSNFRKGKRCPKCRSSKGETTIHNILDSLDIVYETQKTFDGLVNINNLSYDFYLPKHNILIEYQGEQHYNPVEFFGGKSQFELQVELDNLKRVFAKDNNIKLLEIPYTKVAEEDIKRVILEVLS